MKATPSTSISAAQFQPHPEAIESTLDRVLVTLEMNREQFEKIEPRLDQIVLEWKLIAHVRVG